MSKPSESSDGRPDHDPNRPDPPGQIAASNLINTALLASAVLFYGQLRDFATLRFLDELGFAALAVAAHCC